MSRVVEVRTESRYCSRCSKRVDGQVSLDAEGRIVDSLGFVVFAEGDTLCDECLVRLAADGDETLTEEERTWLPAIRDASAGLLRRGMVATDGRYGLALTPAGVACLLSEWHAHDESKGLNPDEAQLLRRLGEEDLASDSYFRRTLDAYRAGRWSVQWAIVLHRTTTTRR